MKRTRTAAELAAASAARKRGLFMAAVGLIVGLVMLGLSSNFLTMHCVMAAAVALAGGIASARAAILHHRPSGRAGGVTGGLYAALAYALPFMVYNFINWLSVTEESAAIRMAQMTPEQLAAIREQNLVLGAEYFRGQDISFLFGYLLFALLFGWLFGTLGAVLANRQLGQNTPAR